MSGDRASWEAAEQAARDSYGRLVAWLAWRWRDIAAAEDALSDALLAALTNWPAGGVPDAPDAWLLTAAKRNLLQRARHARVAQSPDFVALLADEPEAPEAMQIPDRRLMLMFVCAHPDIPPAMHAPLMLQTVLGLEAKTIAEAFLVSPSAMAQRLVRAKAGIREAGLRFEEPEPRELPHRLSAVLEGIYGAYAIGANTAAHGPETNQPTQVSALRGEALYLARLVAELQPDSAEAHGLLALLLYCEARAPAQFDRDGRFVPLTAQDTTRWDHALIRQAETVLSRASALARPGHFQLEAAIQSAHCQRAFTGQTPWSAIAQLYSTLVAHFPSIGAKIGRAVALAESGALDQGLTALGDIPERDIVDHQPYWVALAHLQRKAGNPEHSQQALQRAIGLTADERVRRYLQAASPTTAP